MLRYPIVQTSEFYPDNSDAMSLRTNKLICIVSYQSLSVRFKVSMISSITTSGCLGAYRELLITF